MCDINLKLIFERKYMQIAITSNKEVKENRAVHIHKNQFL